MLILQKNSVHSFHPRGSIFLRHEPKQLVIVASVKHYFICGFHLTRGNEFHADIGCNPCRATNIGVQSGLEDLDLKVKFVSAMPCAMDLYRVGFRQLHELILDVFDPLNLNSLGKQTWGSNFWKSFALGGSQQACAKHRSIHGRMQFPRDKFQQTSLRKKGCQKRFLSQALVTLMFSLTAKSIDKFLHLLNLLTQVKAIMCFWSDVSCLVGCNMRLEMFLLQRQQLLDIFHCDF